MIASEKIIDKWYEAHTYGHNVAWVARELGMEDSALRNRVKLMRKRGVELPELPKYKKSEANRLNYIMERKRKS